MATALKTRVREEEYLATMTGEKPSLEFVNGEVFQKPMPKREHNEVGKPLARAFLDYERRHGGTFAWEATTDLSDGSDRRYRVPDYAFWSRGRAVVRPDDVYLPPTLAIEVRSRGQSRGELQEKCREYRERGVDVCWLIDPETRTVEVFDGDHDGTALPRDGVLESPRLPGFALPVVELWAGLD
jgi:Uma2 family endonuclease